MKPCSSLRPYDEQDAIDAFLAEGCPNVGDHATNRPASPSPPRGRGGADPSASSSTDAPLHKGLPTVCTPESAPREWKRREGFIGSVIDEPPPTEWKFQERLIGVPDSAYAAAS